MFEMFFVEFVVFRADVDDWCFGIFTTSRLFYTLRILTETSYRKVSQGRADRRSSGEILNAPSLTLLTSSYQLR